MKKLYFILGLILAATIFGSGEAQAWTNNRLMDDPIFDNVGTMDEGAIQNFLASKGPCLKDYQTIDFNWNGSVWSYGPGNISAARAIYKSAQMWGLNPQVIIATLQKEQSLVSGSSCDGWRYNSAMGYGCPDSGGCNPKYVGFSKQVLWGGWQLKFGKERSYGNTAWDGDGALTYSGYMTQGYRKRCDTCATYYYDGYGSIDGQSIYLENGTTASLYSYTPHLGQSFPGIFESWFGSTFANTYSWNIDSWTSDKDLTNLGLGQKAHITLRARNTGSNSWLNYGPNPVKLGTARNLERASGLYTDGWEGNARPALLKEYSVSSGQIGTFEFDIQPPYSSTTDYLEYFSLLAEGAVYFNDPGFYLSVHVAAVSGYSFTVNSLELPNQIESDQIVKGTLLATNNGSSDWYNNGHFPIKIGTSSPRDHNGTYYDSSWLSATRIVKLNQTVLKPGQVGSFDFYIKAPHVKGLVTEKFSLVAEGLTWFNTEFTVTYDIKGSYNASVPKLRQAVVAGETLTYNIQITNTGTETWSNIGANPVKIGTLPWFRQSGFCTGSWPDCTRPAVLTEASVPPNQIGTFSIELKPNPSLRGLYSERLQLVAESKTWFGNEFSLEIDVKAPVYSYSYVSDESFTDSTKTTPLALTSLSPGQRGWIELKVRNTGNSTWYNDGNYPVKMGTWQPSDRVSAFADSSWLANTRPALLYESSVAPGNIGTFKFTFTAPQGGNYTERFSLVSEDWTWATGPQLIWNMTVSSSMSFSYVSDSHYTTQAKDTPANLSNLSPGNSVWIELKVRNTGDTIWYRSGNFPVKLVTWVPQARLSRFNDSTWLDITHPAGLKEASVGPGEIATFEFYFKVPGGQGNFYEYFMIKADNSPYMSGPLLIWKMQVNSTYTYSYISDASFTDSSKTTPANLQSLYPGQTAWIELKVRNTGNATWYNNGYYPVRIATLAPIDRESRFSDISWISKSRSTALKELQVAPGETATFEFLFSVPSGSGDFIERFTLVAEFWDWMSGPQLIWSLHVN